MSGMTTSAHAGASDILIESVQLSQEYLNQILVRLQQLPAIQEMRAHDLHQMVSSLTLDVGTFVEVTTLISRMFQKKLNVNIQGARESHVHLLFVMKGINQSQLKGDLVALEELIKYELKDNLTQWKIDLIPQAKRHLNP